MGIKNLNKFLQKHTPQSFREISLQKYAGKRIAIDVTLYLFEYKKNYRDNWIAQFLRLVMCLQKHNITCVFIYDTKAPAEKNRKKLERKQTRLRAEQRAYEIDMAIENYLEHGEPSKILLDMMHKKGHKKLLSSTNALVSAIDMNVIQKELSRQQSVSIYLTRYDIDTSKEVLDSLGIPHYNSETEAETLCAYLCCYNLVDAVLSNDTDVMVYGTPIFLSKISLRHETVTEIKVDALCESIQLSLESFRDFCIMCGCDYNTNMHRIGPEKAYKLLMEHTSLENIQKLKKHDTSCLNFERVREIFTIPTVPPGEEYKVSYSPSNFNRLQELIFKNNVRMNVNDIKCLWS
jgi:5'-3' exonuclease